MISTVKLFISALALASVTLSQDSAAPLSITSVVANAPQPSISASSEYPRVRNGTAHEHSGNHTDVGNAHHNGTFSAEHTGNGTHHKHGNHTGTFTGLRPTGSRPAMSGSVSAALSTADGTTDDSMMLSSSAPARRLLRRNTFKRRQDADTSSSSFPAAPTGSDHPSATAGVHNGTFPRPPHNGTGPPPGDLGRNATVGMGLAGHNGTHFGPPPMGGNATLPDGSGLPSPPTGTPPTGTPTGNPPTDLPQISSAATDTAAVRKARRGNSLPANTRNKKRATCQQ